MNKKFNQKEYIKEYKKTHYKQLSIDLKIKDMEKLDNYCKKNNITKKDFVMKEINKIKDD